ATSYANTTPISTSTLTSSIAGAQIYQVFATSVTANWQAIAAPPGSEGYELDAATDAGFTNVIASSVTPDVNMSTLTVSGLSVNTTYYVRAGGVNWENTTNYVFIGSTQTTASAAVTNATITKVYVSSLTVTWTGGQAGVSGYDIEASTGAWPNSFTGNISSVTMNASAATLTFTGGS